MSKRSVGESKDISTARELVHRAFMTTASRGGVAPFCGRPDGKHPCGVLCDTVTDAVRAASSAPGQQPGSCSPACVHLMEAATLSARLVEAEEARDRALGLLNRWLSQHSAGGATDPCCVAAELVKESWAAVYPPKEPRP